MEVVCLHKLCFFFFSGMVSFISSSTEVCCVAVKIFIAYLSYDAWQELATNNSGKDGKGNTCGIP